jgi:hypothetical protein
MLIHVAEYRNAHKQTTEDVGHRCNFFIVTFCGLQHIHQTIALVFSCFILLIIKKIRG